MSFAAALSHVHWIAVLAVTVGSFALGFAWHQPFLFGKRWAEENRESHARRPQSIPLTFGGTAVAHLVAFTALAVFVSGTSAANGLELGLAVAATWVLPAMAGTYLFANRSLALLAIDAGMYLVAFGAAGAVLAVW